MKITTEWLAEKGACSEGVEWFKVQKETDDIKVLNALMADDKWNWANWLIARVMTRPQYLAYAIFAAEQVIEIYEKEYPDDKRPRKAIEAAMIVLKNDTEKNRDAAEAVWHFAWDAIGAAARAAAGAVAGAVWHSAEAAAGAAMDAAEAVAGAARKQMQLKIIEHGIGLLK